MTRDGKILLGMLLVALALGAYSHSTLRREVRHAQNLARICTCPQDTSGQVAVAEISRHHRYATTSHSYFERLLEGLVRHAGLPLEKAREDLTRSHGKFIPPDWKWLDPWESESTQPASPSPSQPPGSPPATGAPPSTP